MAKMTNFTLPGLVIFMASWNREFIGFSDFFIIFAATIFLPWVPASPQPRVAAKMAREQENPVKERLQETYDEIYNVLVKTT